MIRCTSGTLRRLFQPETSSALSTTRMFFALETALSAPMAVLVDGVPSIASVDSTCTLPPRARSDRAPRSAAAFIFFGVRWA